METARSLEGVAPLVESSSLPLRANVVSAGKSRLASIDRVRGLVIALMALDHVRDYFSNFAFDSTDLEHTSTALFLTRWITHYCAPTFIFLAGVSARLVSVRTGTRGLQRFLLTRGVWLVLLEFTVVMFCWTFNFRYPMGLVMQVIWAIGASMCVLAALVVLPALAVGVIAAIMIAGHNLLDPITPEAFGSWAPLWHVLHVPGKAPWGAVLYPLVPWVGVMALGYALGAAYQWESARRQRAWFAIGAACCLGFLAIRALNGYGDPHPWSVQARDGFTWLSFLKVTKYPPSLAYVLMTLGPALLLLAAFERVGSPLLRPVEVFGRVPLFAYVVHLALAHALAGTIGFIQGFGAAILTNIFLFYPEEWGFGLGGVYCAWLAVLIALYPLCAWFASVKARRRDWWLAYL